MNVESRSYLAGFGHLYSLQRLIWGRAKLAVVTTRPEYRHYPNHPIVVLPYDRSTTSY